MDTEDKLLTGVILLLFLGVYLKLNEFDPKNGFDGTVININDDIINVQPDGYNTVVMFYRNMSEIPDNNMQSLNKWYSHGDRVTVYYSKINNDFFVANHNQNNGLRFEWMSPNLV
ncbi:MAG: hypothetical protein WC623_22340 [Pedobacter sp.]|uniref:hypothetical protein n=1 Tax=Pedobacter sp. TaxID=1411316 RepID=UPI003567CEED